MDNSEIAAFFDTIADLLDIKGDNPFRIRAYRSAARAVGEFSRSVSDMAGRGGDLTEIPGVGADLAGKIAEIVRTGELPLLRDLEKEFPPGIVRLLRVPGLGPKRVGTLYKALGIGSVEDLKKAALAGKIRALPGFGSKIESGIVENAERMSEEPRRFKLAVAEQIAGPLVEHLKKSGGVREVVVAGSYRRRRETVGDLDILVVGKSGTAIMERFIGYEGVAEIVAKGDTRSTVLLRSGMQVDLRTVPPASFGAALHYFTGSKAHVIAVRKLGVRRKLKINEYGVFRGEKRLAGRTESEVFARVGLPCIEPELREDMGEIEAGQRKSLPALVDLPDIRGDLHVHTDATDGRAGLADMASAARRKGYDYLAITDHSRRLTVARGLTVDRLRRQIEEIDRFNDKSPGIRVLKSIEVDILDDGTLDLPDEVLKELDFVLGSIHSKFQLPAKKQTDRIVRAMDNRHFNILGHPSGRLIGERRPYEVDMARVVDAARERGCFLELDGHPDRLDLNDVHCRMAKEKGVKVAISTDAHSVEDLNHMRFGVGQARRGWLEANDVLNARTWAELKKLLKR